MYRNRLIELTTLTKEPQAIGAKLRESALEDTITDVPEDIRYSQARELIAQLNRVVQYLQQSKREYFKTSKPEKQKQIYDSINQNIAKANKAMKQLKPIVEQVNEEFKQESEQGNKSRLVECNRITLEASKAIKSLKDIEGEISEQIKSTLQRQATMIQGQNLSDRELEDLVNQPQKGQQMLREKLLDSPSVELENAVSDIIDKCNQVLRLERNMRQCLRMMEDLADLVRFQGEKLLTIEQALQGAQDHVERGQQKLEKGKELHKKSQKKMCCIMFILLLIVGVIVIPIIITKL